MTPDRAEEGKTSKTRWTYRSCRIAGEELVAIEFGRRVAVRGGKTELARKAEVSQAMISRIIAGEEAITPKIAAALGFALRYERVS